ncbi:hypothetical protein R8510_05383 [Ralstonia chuxiongensis]|nr:hypothetical protein R8510_05383 [Ralstonia chuxiongensis]
MNGVADFTFEPVALHAVVRLDMPDDGLDGLPSLQQTALSRIQALVFAPVNHLDGRHLGIDAPVAQIDDRGMGLGRAG